MTIVVSGRWIIMRDSASTKAASGKVRGALRNRGCCGISGFERKAWCQASDDGEKARTTRSTVVSSKTRRVLCMSVTGTVLQPLSRKKGENSVRERTLGKTRGRRARRRTSRRSTTVTCRATQTNDFFTLLRKKHQTLATKRVKNGRCAIISHRSSRPCPAGSGPDSPSAETSFATAPVVPVPVKRTTSSAARPVTLPTHSTIKHST